MNGVNGESVRKSAEMVHELRKEKRWPKRTLEERALDIQRKMSLAKIKNAQV